MITTFVIHVACFAFAWTLLHTMWKSHQAETITFEYIVQDALEGLGVGIFLTSLILYTWTT